MKFALFLLLIVGAFAAPVLAQDAPLDLSNVVSADVDRVDVGTTGVHAFITINLVNPVGNPAASTFKWDVSIDQADVAIYKGGTGAQKLAIAKKYIRLAIWFYLQAQIPPPSITDQGSANVTKAQISSAGDTQ